MVASIGRLEGPLDFKCPACKKPIHLELDHVDADISCPHCTEYLTFDGYVVCVKAAAQPVKPSALEKVKGAIVGFVEEQKQISEKAKIKRAEFEAKNFRCDNCRKWVPKGADFCGGWTGVQTFPHEDGLVSRS